MIRINLLSSAEDRTGFPNPSWRGRVSAGGAAVLMAAALVLVAWWHWALRAEAAEVDRARADLAASLRRLAPAVAAVQDAEAQRDRLGARVAVIEALEFRRFAAVRMLDLLSHALPDGLWFSEVGEEAEGVIVRGHAATPATVSDYAGALEAAGDLGAPVELVDSRRGGGAGGQIVSFELRVPFPAPAGER